MSGDTSTVALNQALVTVGQVSYNTNYAIDLSKDGNAQQVKIYTATGIEVTPGSFEQDDGGSCGLVDAELRRNRR